MLPIIFGIGAAVAIGTSCIAWLCDEATEKEEAKHRDLEEKISDLQSKLDEFDVTLETETIAGLRKSILKVIEKLSEGCNQFSEHKSQLKKELERLPAYISAEIENDEIGPFRREALIKNRCLIEDASARLKAYFDYLDGYRKNLDMWREATGNRNSIDDLQKLLQTITPPNPTLPDEFLYVGKVVLIKESELDRNLAYSSKLHLTGQKNSPQCVAQKRVFESNKDDEGYSPVQVINQTSGKHGNKVFYGCSARGAVWQTIEEGTTFEVDHRANKNKCYKLKAYEGEIQVDLPEHMVENPFIGLISGQQVNAWFYEYDLLLGGKRLKQSERQSIKQTVKVSMTPSNSTELSEEPVYLLFDERDIQDDFANFLSIDGVSDWMLAGSRIDVDNNKYSGVIDLVNQRIKVTCAIDALGGFLIAKSWEEYLPTGQETSLNVDVIPLSQSIWSDHLYGNEGLVSLCGYCQQAEVSRSSNNLRHESAVFFDRWRQVVEYQKKAKEFVLEFPITQPESTECGELTIPHVEKIISEGTATTAQWLKEYRRIEKGIKGNWSPSCSLEIYYGSEKGNQNSTWRKVADSSGKGNRRLELQVENGLISVSLNEATSGKIVSHGGYARLTVDERDASLQRQQDALVDFKKDRIANPMLKEILVSPSSYISKSDLHWKNYFSENVAWQNELLTDSQKRVIESALSEKYLSIIQGPPGTAKTTSIVEMLFQIYQSNPNARVLLVSQQHTAVDNALDRFLNISPLLKESAPDILRIGPEEKMHGAIKPYALGTVLDEFKSNCIDKTEELIMGGDAVLRNLAFQWRNAVLPSDEESRTDPELVSLFLNSRQLVGSTCVGLASRIGSTDKLKFDVVIVDEAGRSTVPELLIPINRARKLILIGDHFQLPPSIAPLLREDDAKEELAFIEEEFLETSFFERLYESLPKLCKTRLEEQFRMPEAIGDLVANMFYTIEGERRLFNGRRKCECKFLFQSKEIIQWVDVKGKQEKPKNSTSSKNEREAYQIVAFIEATSKYLKGSFKNKLPCGCNEFKINESGDVHKSVAVITPYGEQKRLLRSLLEKHQGVFRSNEDRNTFILGNLSIRIDTVDSFQGSEADLVLYSVVRTYGDLRFILDWKRLNVACSRAKESLVFFGHKSFLKNWKPRMHERNLFGEIIDLLEVEKMQKEKCLV
ncbi:DEAD/DEAH box helicase [Marinomonas sp. PE14-40]|uniref:DEAD/DEAH box helicase n=1 Tax=Marinomonas sp. PE14-40 TaxID=3060621 RepID=UPI003F681C07